MAIRKVGGPGGGEYAAGSGGEESSKVEAEAGRVKKTMQSFQGDSLQESNLQGRISEGPKDSTTNKTVKVASNSKTII